jgi:hypothetical protein
MILDLEIARLTSRSETDENLSTTAVANYLIIILVCCHVNILLIGYFFASHWVPLFGDYF